MMQGNSPRFVALLAGLVLSSCCGTGSRAPCDKSCVASLTCERPAAMRTPGWLELRDLTFHADADSAKAPPTEPYVRGEWIGGFFDAKGEVVGQVGDPPKGRSLTRGYLELRTRSFYRNDAQRSRVAPWIEGARDDDSGGFFPGASISWSSP
jgi:hypothetical protein